MIFADLGLARRLEGLICAEFRRLAEVAGAALPGRQAARLEVAGGVALWLGEGSPVNQAVGLGMAGPVDDEDMESLEAFYHGRGADAVASISPFVDPSFVAALGRRGWRATEFEHLLVRGLDEVALPAGLDTRLDVRVCTPRERPAWSRVASLGFADGGSPGQGQEEFGLIMAAREEAVLVLAWVGGQPAGTGALVIDGGVGWLSGDSTLPEYRGRGVQQALQSLRLRLAAEAGCDLAVTEAAPGGTSQRNMERLGFRIAYTHTEFAKPVGATEAGAASGR